MGVVFFPSFPPVGVVLFPSPTHLWNWIGERIRRGGEGGYASKGKLLSPTFSIIPILPSFLPIPPFLLLLLLPFLSPFLSLSLSPSLFLSPSLSLALSCGFYLNWVLADVKNGFVDCNFLRCGE